MDIRSFIEKAPSRHQLSRRAMLRAAGCGFGFLGLGSLLAQADTDPLAPKAPVFPARAKRVIFLFMHGGPSSIDSFDPKPYLDANDGKPLPIKQPLTFAAGKTGGLMKSPWAFKRSGQCGLPVSDLFPHMRECIDDLCVVRSMVGEGVDHGAALLQTFTGTFTFTRPSLGSWALYGLGTENRNLPGYITIKPALSHGGAKNWSSGFLPGAFQGTAIGHAGMQVNEIKKEPIEYLVNQGLNREQQRYELDMIQAINRKHRELWKMDDELDTRIQSFEMAFRMQAEAQTVFDVSGESEQTKKLYGLDDPKTADFGWQCLLARRLAEKDVRFIQCTHSYKWDQHSDLFVKHNENAAEVDKPIAGLLKDLKARGLLKDTLVIWSGEFGRTPISESGNGRDHNPYGYTLWMAGGGVKPGFAYGATDEFGYHAAENRMHIHDFHATVLALLGLDHEKLTYSYSGRDFRLTDVAGTVHKDIFA
ncbi:MAG TPA: DUF1501 domain-containing protein [Bryobacteraceae bacterium]|nr:DUF1501 domain-containing protein [Bryobacteraceae bacterium]